MLGLMELYRVVKWTHFADFAAWKKTSDEWGKNHKQKRGTKRDISPKTQQVLHGFDQRFSKMSGLS